MIFYRSSQTLLILPHQLRARPVLSWKYTPEASSIIFLPLLVLNLPLGERKYRLVRGRGVEPPRPCGHHHLKVTRLPVTPPARDYFVLMPELLYAFF